MEQLSRSRRSWGKRNMAKSRWGKDKKEEEEEKEMEEERRIMNKEPSTTRLQ